jgi:hypothetical protein
MTSAPLSRCVGVAMNLSHTNCNHAEGESNPFHSYIHQSQRSSSENKMHSSQQKIIDLTKQIERAQEIHSNQLATQTASPGDWTQVYQYWNQWEDVDELKVQKMNETNRLNNFIEENNFMGHCNDHTEVSHTSLTLIYSRDLYLCRKGNFLSCQKSKSYNIVNDIEC